MAEQYYIETSLDNKKWRKMASFEEGENSRYGKPFDIDAAVQEVREFKAHMKDKYPYVRLIIELEHDRQRGV